MALFKQIFANDPNNPQNVAENGVISIFAPGTRDLVPIRTVTGGPLSNPLQLNSRGFGPAFDAPGFTQVAWEAIAPGEVFQGTFESYEGVLEEAVAAKVAAAEGAAAELAQRVEAGEFRGADGQDGKDGSNVVPTAEAIAAEIQTPGTPANTALSATVASEIEEPLAQKSAVTVDGVKVDTFEVDSTPGIVAPAVLVPSTSVIAVAGDAPWRAANLAHFTRITVPVQRNYRYFGVRVGAASGNMQVGVIKLDGANYTRVMSSGVIAATQGLLRLDLGATDLPAGDYGLFVWADNTTLTTNYGNNTAVASLQCVREAVFADGVPASGVLSGAWVATGYITGLSLAAA